MAFVREFLLQRPLGILYHYTNAGGLLGILEQKEIWASSALHLNDATEIRFAFDLLRRKLGKRLADGLVKCLYKPAEHDILIIAAIDYMQRVWRKLEGLEGCRKWAFQSRMIGKVTAVMLAMKHESFEEEQEWRLVGYGPPKVPVRFRSGRFGIVP
jgi:hypothetical protein